MVRLAKGTFVYTAGTVLNKLLLLAIQVLLARMLHVAGYGLYSLGFSALVLLQAVALFGLDQSVLRYAALYRNRAQAEFLKGTLLGSLVLAVGFSAILGILLGVFGSAASTRVFREPELAPVIGIFACALPCVVTARVTGAFAQAHHDIVSMTAIQQISQPGLNLLLVAALFLFAKSLRWAVAAFVLSSLFSAALGLHAVYRIFPEFFGSLRARIHGREFLRYSLAMASVAALYQLFWRAPTLLLGRLGDAWQVGLYTAAVTLASPPGFLSLIFAQPFLPMMVDLHEQERFPELRSLYATVCRWTQLVVIPSLGALILFRRPVLALFGRDFQTAQTVLIPVGIAWMIYYAKGPVSAVMDMTGRQFLDLANLAGVLVLSLVLSVRLIPRFGVAGAAWAVAAAVLAWSVAEAIEGWICFRFPPVSESFVRSFALGSIVFAAGLLAEPRLGWIPDAVLVCALYAALSYRFGITAEDRELLKHGFCKLNVLVARGFFLRSQPPSGLNRF